MQQSFYTIGYEGSQVEAFVSTLRRTGVKTLIDVRDLPLSRKRGFSKSALAANLEASGIAYVHLKGLGDPKPGRDAARAGEYAEFRRIFGRHMKSEFAQRDLSRAAELIRCQPCCLMCFEQDHCNCHRSIVADHLVRQTGLQLHHLSIDSSIRSYAQRPHLPGFSLA
ncbi:DUF488 domain-containing protein [Bradyrhizobium sp. 35]|uniref:DUF488 domain-containing protein n=1 Tax=Bradyrhizobium sp. 35 TaxID=2782670 RepID=UPI001FF908E3|nr:DUF488 domain-containing protein [Bradyrhizobium sp. 35]MCK1449615.1 DUF488 domain-containing protein [Bradyrhizobium sp. 35]